jgi:serine/threonine protein kinase
MTDSDTNVFSPGDVFAGRYRIERFLAKGGMGAVFVAEHEGTERRVALKVLLGEVMASDGMRERFALEARLANRIKSEHVVEVLDAGYDQATCLPFLVMELLEGSDLERLVTTTGALSAEQVVGCLRQVSAALDKAHNYVDRDGRPQPIIHRDLKPENLFLTRRATGEPLVKLLDFGIAKVLGGETKISQDIRGTPTYMAPEQIEAR